MSNYPPNPQGYPQYAPIMPPAAPAVPKGPRRYSMLGAMIRAPFFNADVYRDVARNWSGIGFWYLFWLLLATWIAVMVKLHVVMAGFVQNDFPAWVKDVPPITISNGHATSPVEQPYVIQEPKSGKPFAVIDTTGTINSLDDTKAVILLTDHKLWVRQNQRGNGNEVRQYDLTRVKYFYVDKARITGWMEVLGRFLAIGVLPVVLVFSLIWRTVQALIYGAINLGLSSGFRSNLNYADAVRLAVVSVTPVILLSTVLWIAKVTIPFWGVLGIGISLLYMVMAVRANGNPYSGPTGGFPVVTGSPANPQYPTPPTAY